MDTSDSEDLSDSNEETEPTPSTSKEDMEVEVSESEEWNSASTMFIEASSSFSVVVNPSVSKDQEHIDVVCANLRSALLVAEHNLSFNVIDHITKINKVNFKDSKVAESLQLSRTKCTMIIQNVLADVITNQTQVLGLKELDCDHGTAKGLYALLKQSLTEFNIEAKNVVGYCADNASVMMGSKESVKQYLLNSNPHLISNGCICHTIHLVAVSAAACLPEKLENLLQNISTYFS
ncbi:hypothetical protein NQ314_003557 [Rhamnusium bicolor]|uniref:DUF4371 domain-containing protein n=1 Tax=Rhamnusium bicolor TaxID=1586634 RepID=A0AAV8ZNE1_9CUCU|nr:hypothetical protein NQ314_003557 [Rhamnusium bicolor]